MTITTVGGLERFLVPGSVDRNMYTCETIPLCQCRHCGHEAAFKRDASAGHYDFSIAVMCSNTSCGIGTPYHYKSEYEAAKAWNRTPQPPPVWDAPVSQPFRKPYPY